ncbi:ubiquitin-conjugating enzyme E2 T [Parasteatoda tepidariorum]|uniref:Ubiquitin-conjugating enzyme E2 T n=1 Tax=Parasteatoda tepidariorum TaxID=114398 RepID=A0A2L2XVS6_PARTP|nr:ubiquitin-conjugating enzyme E2 T [Parasteatoda tepidariorum]XP_015903130.1 ubiquitin-conjugating enzyme E2 T [Parasteatoda tepidariorum]XP_042895735.1 ubiquitin-conjugating enzyme E2 T [Parasteatoda tepidariorum]
MQFLMRLKKEMERFHTHSLHGISCWQTENVQQLQASIVGPDGTPYEDGVFQIDIQIPDRYPFVPPNVRFATPVYHPNIDDSGRICLDTLKLPPQGSWKPCLNLSSVLIGIQLLMSEPNFDDPLMSEIAQEYQSNRESFLKHAKEWTDKFAKKQSAEKSSTDNVKSLNGASSSKKHTLDITESPEPKRFCL